MDRTLEKSMANFKNSLKTQTIMQVAGALVLIAVNVMSFTGIISPPAWETWSDVWTGFISGASAAALILLLAGMVMNIRALKNESAFKKMYIRENDERRLEICHRSAHASYWPDAVGLLLGAIISGYFSPVVSITCIACLMYICAVRIVFKIVYSRKI